MGKIFIVIPVYNEEEVISQVIRDVTKAGYKDIIVVDDGSTDRTYLKAKKENITTLRHILNRGKGAAIKTGIEAAKLLGADSIVTFDGDGQHNPKDIGKIVSLLNKGNSIVLGTRSFDKVPALKRSANFLGNLLTWALYGMSVKDSQSGLRGFSKKALSIIDTQNDRYEYDSEVIREIARNKLKYIEVPIEVFYTKYSQSKQSRQGFVNGIKTLYRMVISA